MSNGGLKTRDYGNEKSEALTIGKMNAIKLTESSTAEEVASMGLTAVREIFPIKDQESTLAVRLRIEMLTDIVNEVGPEKFLAAIKKAITMSSHRYDCSIRKIRECAGLKEKNPAIEAWKFVTEVMQKHLRPAPEGHYHLEPWVRNEDGKFVTDPVPVIPESVKDAVRAIGGWQALALTSPEYLHQRMKDFINLFEE